MPKKRVCPFCGSGALKTWALGKVKCGKCESVIRRGEVLVVDSTPKPRRATRDISDAQEKLAARRVGGRRTVASGSSPAVKEKGDVLADDLRAECKSTKNKSFSLKKDDLDKIASQARGGEIPVFIVEFREPTKKQYYVLDEGWFLSLLEAYRDRDDQ